MRNKFFLGLIFLLPLILTACFFLKSSQAQTPSGETEKDMQDDSFIYEDKNRPDPFVPLLDKTGSTPSAGPSLEDEMQLRLKRIKINGILWEEKDPLVMINNKIRRQGDVVEELVVKEISVNRVVFEFKGLTSKIDIIKQENQNEQGGER